MKNIIVKKTGITDPMEIMKILSEEGYHGVFSWYDTPNTYYPWHKHNDYEVRWIYEGELIVGTKEGEVILKPGDRLEVLPNTLHWAKTETGVHYIAGSK
ncbi:MAG: cupin domain-containing protein [Persephonella sp.]|nr:MAG: cupin domain-containing protein [Persephonella sp.]